MLLNYGIEDSWESLDCKEIQAVNPKGNQTLIFIGRTDAEVETAILMQRTNSLEKTLMLGKSEGRRRRVQQRIRWLDGITDFWTRVWVSSRSWWWTGKPEMLQSIGSQRSQTWLINWTELNWTEALTLLFLLLENKKFSVKFYSFFLLLIKQTLWGHPQCASTMSILGDIKMKTTKVSTFWPWD